MTNEEQISKLNLAIALTTEVRDAISPPPPPDSITVTPGQSVQAAIDAAPFGATINFAPGVYEGQITIRKSIVLQPQQALPPGLVGADSPIWLTSRANQTVLIAPEADVVTLRGIGCKNTDAGSELFTVLGSQVLFDRCVGMGDPINGNHRGWRVEGHSIWLTNCYSDFIRLKARDSCVLGSWQDLDGLEVSGCYFSGGAETIMFGGADSPSADRMPKNIRILNTVMTHRPEWYAEGAQIKTPFELKCATNVYMSGCTLEYAGVAEGQGAYLILLTVRNQNGKAPWSTIKDVLIENCICRSGGGGVNILGYDNNYPGGAVMDNVVIRNVAFTGLNPEGLWSKVYKGSGRGVQFDRRPNAVTMEGITIEGTNLGALGYFMNNPNQPSGLTLRNWKYPPTKYGWKIDGGGFDTPPTCTNLKKLMPDLVYEVTAIDPGATFS